MNKLRPRFLAATGIASSLALAATLSPSLTQANAADVSQADTGGLSFASLATADPKGKAAIRLQAGTWIPGQQTAPAAKATRKAPSLKASEKGLYLLQFNGPVLSEWTTEVQQLGASLLTYVPDNAYVARLTPKLAAQLGKLDSVAWVGRYEGDWKFTSSGRAKADKVAKFNPNAKRTDDNAPAGLFYVSGTADAGASLAKDIGGAGAALARQDADGAVVIADAAQLDALAQSEFVQSIDTFTFMETLNEHEQGDIMAGNTANTNGYDGRTQIAAVMDTGFAYGSAKRSHPGIPAERINKILDYSNGAENCYRTLRDGAQDVDSGHGTHVAVSVVGQGDENGIGKAAANKARLIFQAVEDWADFEGLCSLSYPDMYILAGIGEVGPQLRSAADLGARVSSNSWGGGNPGAYSVDASSADRLVSEFPQYTVLFAAGNSGVDANGDGVVDSGSVSSPATAKNVIAVGASESDRPDWVCDTSLDYPTSGGEGRTFGGQSCKQLGGKMPLPAWGDWWPTNYRAEPLKSDIQADSRDQMAAFSSRGPTLDNRIKPDLVAPGSWTLSGYSPMHQQGYGGEVNPRNGNFQFDGYGLPYNKDYKYLSGTSMSTPAAASGALVVRDFLKQKYNIEASAALVKASLVNSAVDLVDENNDGADDNKFPIPNVHEGWGRVNLENATRGTALYIDESGENVLTTGTVKSQTINVDGTKPLKVSMAWSDPAALGTAAKTLINDVDLEVVSPTGQVYLGNSFEGGWSKAAGTRDSANNLENVYLQNPAAGAWTVRVKGTNIPSASQKYAMVIDGATDRTPDTKAPVVTNVGVYEYVRGVPMTLQIEAFDPDGGALTYTAEGLPAGLSIDPATGLISGTGTSVSSTTTVTATDSEGLSNSTTFRMISTVEDSKNLAPLAPASISQVWAVGQDPEFDFSKLVSDPDGDKLSFNSLALPAGLSLDPNTGILTGRFTEVVTGGSFTVNVTDGVATRAIRVFYNVMDTPIAGERIVNGGFEQDGAGWTGPDVSLASSNPAPHSGGYVGRLGGNGYVSSDKISQQFVVRPESKTLLGSMWTRVVTDETGKTAQDTLKLNVLDQNGNLLETVATLSNRDAGKRWVQQKYDLSKYVGKTVRLEWVTSENASKATHFYLDDISFVTS